MCEENNEIREYELLRTEINKKLELHNSLLTFTITTVSAILTFALTSSNEYLCLVPFCIIVPMSKRILYYKSSMIKISSYMVVYLENHISGLNWETRNLKINTIEKGFTNIQLECLLLSIICYIAYIIKADISVFLFYNVLKILFPVVIILYEVKITLQLNSVNKQRVNWIKKWRSLMENHENK